MSKMNGTTAGFEAIYHDNLKRINEGSAPFFNTFREEAMKKFILAGVPTRKNEAYRYTNLDSFFKSEYKGYFLPETADFSVAEEFRCDVEELDAHGLVLLNGFYPTLESGLKQINGGIWVGSINEAAKKFPKEVESHYNRYASQSDDSLVSLNTGMASDGVFMLIPKNTKPEKPIQVVNLVHSTEDIFVQHRNLIVVEDGADVTLIICDHTLSPQKFLTNAVTEVYVGKNARFEIIRVQNEHNNAGKLTHTFIHQERDSVASSNNITLHGGLVRNSTHHFLMGENAECNSLGLYLADKFQHVDNYVNVIHHAPNCRSNQLFKGVLDDMATGAFNGRILVKEGAQKTLAYQSNNSILLTDDAKMDSKPQLEIFADDVKCSHGATVGQLDDNALFYLRSRGIDEREARLMLMFGFAHEVIQTIRIKALQERMDNLVMQRLQGELSRCASCTIKCS